MVSYLELIQRSLFFEQMNKNQKKMNPTTNMPNITFGHLFQRSLEDIDIKNLLLQNNTAESGFSKPIDEEAKFRECLAFVLEKEGSKLVRRDGGSGESSKYGILQSTARAFGYKGNIQAITRSQAEKIYKKLWEQSGAASLSFPLAVVHFDSYVNNPASSKRFLEKSQGDVGTYLKLREQRYMRLAAAKPEVYGKYLQGWKNRIKGLETMVAAYIKPNAYVENSDAHAKNV